MNKKSAATLLVIAVLGGAIAYSLVAFKAQWQHSNQKAAMASELASFVATEKPTQTYVSVPEPQKQKFLEDTAQYYGLAPNVEATPEALVQACLDQRQRDLSSIVIANRDKIDEYKTIFNEAAATTRNYCYQKFDPSGTMPHDAMPRSMHH